MARIARLFVPLDVEFATDPKILAAGHTAAYLYLCSLAYAKRSGSEGEIHANQLKVLAHSLPGRAERHAATLVETGLWTTTATGWLITSWARHNLSGEQLVDRKNMQRAKAIAGNHARHHVAKNVKDDDCELCTQPTPNGPHGDRESSPQRDGMVPRDREGRGIEKGEGEGERIPSDSPAVSNSVAPDRPGRDEGRCEQIVAHFVRLGVDGMEAKGEPIKHPAGIRRHFAEQATTNPNLTKWADMFPTAPPDAVAAWLHGDKGSMRYYPRADELPPPELTDCQSLATVTELHRRDPA